MPANFLTKNYFSFWKKKNTDWLKISEGEYAFDGLTRKTCQKGGIILKPKK